MTTPAFPDARILGVGMTRFTKTPDVSVEELGHCAVLEALSDSGLDRRDIGAVVCGTVQSHPGAGQALLKDLGMTGVPIVNVENACASGSTALIEGLAWIGAGLADIVLVMGVESLSGERGVVTLGSDDYVWGSGFVLPAAYALLASRHMSLYGTTREQFARVAVKSHRNAAANPYAHFRKAVTLEEVLASPMVADPITLFECCPRTDGAAAVIIGTEDAARRSANGNVRIAGAALASGLRSTTSDSVPELTRRTAGIAYERAGIGPKDVDVAEVHDAFAPGEIFYYEELGFCEEGKGGVYIDEGASEIGGDGVAVNPSGGLLSRGHPFGATGLAQIAELTWQLRREAGDRQVDGARVGLAHTMGGTIFELEANACAVHILTS
jgi:benzoylsuccinyl-CoA thiolase BbsB subunit